VSTKSRSSGDPAHGVRVARIRPGSAGASAGLRAQDRILAINGAPLRDAVDFHFSAGDERLRIELEREGAPRTVELRRRRGLDLGVELEAPQPRDIATCANKCVFCFIHQLPKGMRKSLYVKDDDYRLSFLHGNYITLTDLEDAELARIETQRLSPLYVSVHATDPALRHALLGAPRVSRPILPVMARLARAGIRMHAQIVLCPDLNDGAHLRRTVLDLAELYPAVATTAIVPVGLTRHRERLPQLRALTPEEARGLVDEVAGWQEALRSRLGTRFVFLGDEIYLLAGADVPPAPAYEGFAVVEDGVGLVRRFEDGFARLRRRIAPATGRPRPVTVVTGEMFAPRLRRLLGSLGVAGVAADVVPVVNEFFGSRIAVAGLLTGQDIVRQLARRPLGAQVLLPGVAVRETDGVLLDDLTPSDLSRALGTPVRAIEPTPRALVAALLDTRRMSPLTG
jgi:putative radical SAM enzyme (TIGR03279 family)